MNKKTKKHLPKIDLRGIPDAHKKECPFLLDFTVRCIEFYSDNPTKRDQYVCECNPKNQAPQSRGVQNE